jgi:hypothetical protein
VKRKPLRGTLRGQFKHLIHDPKSSGVVVETSKTHPSPIFRAPTAVGAQFLCVGTL